MLSAARGLVKNLMFCYPKWRCKQEFENQRFTRFNERPVEFSFVFRTLADVYPQSVLDVGTGTTSLPHLMRTCGFLVTAIDNVSDYWPAGMLNRHYYVIDDDITKSRLEDSFDAITCISVLEHIENADDAVANMFRLLKPEGHLIMTFPYNERSYQRNVYELPGSSYGQQAPYITQSYSRGELDRWLRSNDGVIVEQEYWRFWEGEHWTVDAQIIPPRKATAEDPHQLTCVHVQRARNNESHTRQRQVVAS